MLFPANADFLSTDRASVFRKRKKPLTFFATKSFGIDGCVATDAPTRENIIKYDSKRINQFFNLLLTDSTHCNIPSKDASNRYIAMFGGYFLP